MAGTQLIFRAAERRDRAGAVASAAAVEGSRTGVWAPMALVIAFAVAAPVSILLAAAGEQPHPLVMLAVLGVGAFGVGLWTADLLSGALVGLVFWLFFDGFDAHRFGVLGWDGHTEAVRLGILVAAGVLGTLAGYARDAYLRHRPVGGLSGPGER